MDINKLLICLVQDKIPCVEVEKILIFTSLVKTTEANERQRVYLGALKQHSPSIEITYGRFIPAKKKGNIIDTTTRVTINTFEEKETDVNIACRIVEDAYKEADSFDICCLVSKDSDFVYPLAAKQRLNQRMLLITPRTIKSGIPISADQKKGIPKRLKKYIPYEDRIFAIEKELVEDCRLPDKIGRFTKPTEWN